MALTSIPFCSYDGCQAGLLYLPACWRYTTDPGFIRESKISRCSARSFGVISEITLCPSTLCQYFKADAWSRCVLGALCGCMTARYFTRASASVIGVGFGTKCRPSAICPSMTEAQHRHSLRVGNVAETTGCPLRLDTDAVGDRSILSSVRVDRRHRCCS
jgi:hypothetical protein